LRCLGNESWDVVDKAWSRGSLHGCCKAGRSEENVTGHNLEIGRSVGRSLDRNALEMFSFSSSLPFRFHLSRDAGISRRQSAIPQTVDRINLWSCQIWITKPNLERRATSERAVDMTHHSGSLCRQASLDRQVKLQAFVTLLAMRRPRCSGRKHCSTAPSRIEELGSVRSQLKRGGCLRRSENKEETNSWGGKPRILMCG
jgi:hypothetical protein